MSLRRAAISSVIWSALENGSVTIVSFLSLIIFAKLLSPSDFGVYSIALAVIEVVGIFTNMFFHDALVRQVNATDDHFNSAFSLSIVLGCLFFALLYAVFPFCTLLIDDSRIAAVGRVMASALLFSAPAAILNARQVRKFGFRILALRSVFGRLAGAALGILAAFLDLGIWALVIQFLSMTVLGTLTLLAFSEWRPRPMIRLAPIVDLLEYSFGSVIALASNFLTKRAFIFFAGTFLGVEQAGFLNLAFRLVDTVWAISATAVSQVLLPTMARLQQDAQRTLEAYRTALGLGCLALFPIFCGIGLVAPELILALFGNKWLPAAEPAFWLGLLVFAQCPRIFCTSLLSVGGQVATVSMTNLLTLTYMAAAISLTRLPSIPWALATWCSSELLNFLLLQYFAYRRFGISFGQFVGDVAPSTIASCMMIIVVMVARARMPESGPMLTLLLLFCAGLLAYFLSLAVFGRRSTFRLARTILMKRGE
ncbi:hypothetical protein E4K64_21150 [Bradyrhizobium frederickii]|uniref:Lipopolysaccharide biosynthesis protein n=1 Tax=Bradyrhizobium frederickii TaxID=2560054 RepID=A0A4Y9P5N5_9BRAD|nr:oligosaccharide flippase family protein [Bradyrhizobium frederickii]TFV73715.1 hypothetical protein E4K64_21150 [Bradyrhizobium frederickii]